MPTSELRDAAWRVTRIDHASTGSSAWRCVGVSEIVRDQEAVFLEGSRKPWSGKVEDPEPVATPPAVLRAYWEKHPMDERCGWSRVPSTGPARERLEALARKGWGA